MDVQKLPKGPLLHFSALWDLYRRPRISKKYFGYFNFSSCGYCRREYLTLWSPFAILSLRYGADLGRSRLVTSLNVISKTRRDWGVSIVLALWDFEIVLSSLTSPFRCHWLHLVISEVKRYIQTFDVLSELYCVLLRRKRRFENRSFS